MFFRTIVEKKMGRQLTGVRPLGGGDINQVYRLGFAGTECVLKLNTRDRFPGMFEREARGLKLIHSAGCRVPEVLKTFSEGGHQFLILEYIETHSGGQGFWERFGRRLAALHGHSSETFGLDHDNYIGSLEQQNGPMEEWTDFFIDRRIRPLMEKALDRNLLNAGHVRGFERLFARFNELVPRERPSLIHGDLWSGNLMCGRGEEPVFIDPAVYFGHREMDLAMTRMFGGFDRRFLDSYEEAMPLEPGLDQRTEIHNLYPTLVHLVLFGRSYLGGIEATLRKFS